MPAVLAGRQATVGTALRGLVTPIVPVLAAVPAGAPVAVGMAAASGARAPVAVGMAAASAVRAPVAGDTAGVARASAPADTAGAGIVAKRRTVGTLRVRARARQSEPPPVGNGGRGGTVIAASASSAARDGTARATGANDRRLAGRGQDLSALPGASRVGRPVPTDVTIATGSGATAAGMTSATRLVGRNGVRLGPVRTGRGMLAGSATINRGRVSSLAPRGPRANTVSAGTCQNASAAPSLTSARNGVAAPRAATVRSGVRRVVARTAPGGRASASVRAARGNRADRDDRVASPVSGSARVRRVRVPRWETAIDLTGAAPRRPRPPDRGSLTASQKTSCPAR
jgi:hypothetical protein